MDIENRINPHSPYDQKVLAQMKNDMQNLLETSKDQGRDTPDFQEDMQKVLDILNKW